MFKYLILLSIICSVAIVNKSTNLNGPYPEYGKDSELNTVMNRLDYYCTMLEVMAPRYEMINEWRFPKEKGIDCSGSMAFIFRNALQDAFKMAGIPFPRVTSRQMANGAWPGVRIKDKEEAWEKADFPTLDFWTYSAKRKEGHTGLNRKKEDANRLTFAEASSSKKYFKRTLMAKGDARWKAWEGILIPELDPAKWRLNK